MCFIAPFVIIEVLAYLFDCICCIIMAIGYDTMQQIESGFYTITRIYLWNIELQQLKIRHMWKIYGRTALNQRKIHSSNITLQIAMNQKIQWSVLNKVNC